MPLLRTLMISFACFAAMAIGAQAGIVVDQEQPMVDEDAGFLGIGGDSFQKLAQTFIAGRTGDMVGLKLPIAGCGSETELVIELREQDRGRPTGPVLRTIRVAGSDVPFSYTGFQEFFFRTRVPISSGDRLAFTVETVGDGSFCSYATAPVGDLYLRGTGFFDSRPNPPGWISQKEFPSEWQDLAFFTLVDDPRAAGRPSGRCVIPGRIDPATGRPLELPISRFVPACRCFEDAGAREFRCGIMHPDFFMIRRIPMPISPAESYIETWEFMPLKKLDGPVLLKREGAEFPNGATLKFTGKAKGRTMERRKLKALAPQDAGLYPGIAVIEYEMENAENEFQKRFGLDTSLDDGNFKGAN